MNSQPQKLLFVCSHNRMRSLTAERMFAGYPGYEVKSAGTEDGARTPLTREHVQWADIIFVMEYDHVERMQDMFGRLMDKEKIISLAIPDIYRLMEPALIEELRAKLSQYVKVPE